MAGGGSVSPGLWVLVAREMWHRAGRRLRRGPPYRWRFSGRTPERVLIAPPDLRLADPQIANEIYLGRFPFAGKLVETGGQSPFQLQIADKGWVRSLHGFRWLRHMRASGSDLAAANARALVTDWIAVNGGRIATPAWDPGTTAKRIIAWLQHSSVVLQGAEFPFYRSFLKSLGVQIRYLRVVAAEIPDGKDRLRARVALAFAALSLPVNKSVLRSVTRHLAAELERQILPDGGHISRNPMVVLEVLADLLPLRQTYANQGEQPPDELIRAVERMLPALRFFRLGDGSLARFNGMGATIQDRIAAVLRHDDTNGAPILHASHSGYQRLSLGGTVVIADTGGPPAIEVSSRAHAGFLAFEMSFGRQLLVVNSGVDTYGVDDFRPLARATAAHSTATLNDTSSARFNLPNGARHWLGNALVEGPKTVTSTRADRPGRQGFVASHDGYASRFGVVHEREMFLSEEGKVLTGIDRFYSPSGGTVASGGADAVALRFHLHPDVQLFRDEHDHLVLSAGDNVWTFFSPDVAPDLEDSIFFASLSGPRRSRQIVLNFKASGVSQIRWRLARSEKPEGESG